MLNTRTVKLSEKAQKIKRKLKKVVAKQEVEPTWLRARAPTGEIFNETLNSVKLHNLHTVCCIGECWNKRHATLMILGSVCTRACAVCNPDKLDPHEPENLAKAIKNLKHVVITSDLPDGGANQFIRCIEEIRKIIPETTIEILTPDLLNKKGAFEAIAVASPDVYNHNIETVPRLHAKDSLFSFTIFAADGKTN